MLDDKKEFSVNYQQLLNPFAVLYPSLNLPKSPSPPVQQMIIATCLSSVLQYWTSNTKHWTLNITCLPSLLQCWTLNAKHRTLNTEHWTPHVCLLHRLLQHSCGHQQVSAIHLNIDASDCGDAMYVVRTRDEDYPWKTNSAGAPWPLPTAITAILKPFLLLLILTGLINDHCLWTSLTLIIQYPHIIFYWCNLEIQNMNI